MTNETRTASVPNVVVGLAIALFGVALLLDRLGVARLADLLYYWPVLLIVFGASIIWQALRGSTGASGEQQPIVAPGLIFIIIFFSVLFAVRGEWRNGEASDPSVTMFGIMSRDARVSDAVEFRGAEMTSVMGGTRLDLRQARIAPGEEAVIHVFGLMGKVEVIVPDDWVVDVSALQVMGGVDDNRLRQVRAEALPSAAPGAGFAKAPRLDVRGFIMMGSLEIDDGRPRGNNGPEPGDQS